VEGTAVDGERGSVARPVHPELGRVRALHLLAVDSGLRALTTLAGDGLRIGPREAHAQFALACALELKFKHYNVKKYKLFQFTLTVADWLCMK